MLAASLATLALVLAPIGAAGDDAPPINPLQRPISDNNVRALARLIQKNPTLVNKEGTQGLPLQAASWRGRAEAARLLLENGAIVDVFSAAGLGRDKQLAALLQKNPKLAHARTRVGLTPMHFAARQSRLAAVKVLLKYKSDINAKGEKYPYEGETPLYVSLYSSRVSHELVELLLTHGTDVNARDPHDNTPLHFAVEYCDKSIVELLLRHKANVNARRWREETPLHWAAYFGCKPGVAEALLAHKADANAKNEFGETPLHVAAGYGRLDLVKLLLAHKADVNIWENETSLSPLMYATAHLHLDVARLLVARGAEVDLHSAIALGLDQRVAALLKRNPELAKMPGRRLASPLLWAARSGNAAAARLLLQNGADPEVQEAEPQFCPPRLEFGTAHAPLFIAVQHGHRAVAAVLLAHKAKVDVRTEQTKETPLHEAATRGDLAIVKLLLTHKANLRATDAYGSTALHRAARGGHKDVVELLLERGATVEFPGLSPLACAASGGSVAVVKLLLDRKARVDGGPGATSTPLHAAAWGGHKAVAELLLARGAAVDARDDQGETPLHFAAKSDARDVASLLLARGAAVDARDKQGCTPLYDAALRGNADMAALLLDRGAAVDARTKYGDTPLHAAASFGRPPDSGVNHAAVARLLLRHKADPNARDKKGQTPLQAASDNPNDEVAELLRQHGAKQ